MNILGLLTRAISEEGADIIRAAITATGLIIVAVVEHGHKYIPYVEELREKKAAEAGPAPERRMMTCEECQLGFDVHPSANAYRCPRCSHVGSIPGRG